MTTIRAAYLDTASSAQTLLTTEAVAADWAKPSAPTGFTVGGLAAPTI